MADKRARVAAAAMALVRLSNPDDEVFIVNFDAEPRRSTSITRAIRLTKGPRAHQSRGETAMRDAVRMRGSE